MEKSNVRLRGRFMLVGLMMLIGLALLPIPAFADGYYLKMSTPPLERKYGSGVNEVTYRMRSGAQPQHNYWFDGYGWTKSLYRSVGVRALENTTRIYDNYNQEKSWAWDYNRETYGAGFALEVHANYYAGPSGDGNYFGVVSTHWVREPVYCQQIDWPTAVSNTFV